MIQDDYPHHRGPQSVSIPRAPQLPVSVTEEKAAAVRTFCAEFPNLGAGSVCDSLRRNGYPDLTMDEVRTVMEA